MISYKCSNCAAELFLDSSGELKCPYCGSKTHLTDTELLDYKETRKNILNQLRAMHDSEANSIDGNKAGRLWEINELVTFEGMDGSEIEINYTFFYEEDEIKTYITKNSVVHIFPASKISYVADFINSVDRIVYPSADIKNMSKYFPVIKANMMLNDGRKLLALAKPENVYPVFAFGNLKPKTTAWIVSRLENFACVFEYSDVTHRGINTNTVFINPKTHEAYLLGGWWKLRTKNSYSNDDLLAIRKTANNIMGEHKKLKIL